MKRKFKNVSVRVHTRKLDRLVAHKKMKDAGIVSPNKGKKMHINSFFADHWREAEYID